MLQLYGFCSSNLYVITVISCKHEWSTAPQTNPGCFWNSPALIRWPTKQQVIFLSTVVCRNTVIQSFPGETHLSIVSVCAHQVISMIKPCLHCISDQISHLCVLCIFSSGPHASFGPSLCPVDGSKWAILQDMGSLVLSRFDIISIWTAEANKVAERRREELRCLQAFHNKGWKCHNRAAEGCWEQVLISEGVSIHSLLTLSPPQTRNRANMLPDPEVPRKEIAFTVAAVVYNSLWSHLICDTSRHFSQCLLGIWIMKEQWLKSAFSFSTSSISCPSERQAFVSQLQTPRWRLEVFPMGGSKAWPQLWLRVCKGLTWEM